MENLGYGVKHKRGQMKPSRRYHRRLTANIVAIWPCQLDALPIQRLRQIADLMGEKHRGIVWFGRKTTYTSRMPGGYRKWIGARRERYSPADSSTAGLYLFMSSLASSRATIPWNADLYCGGAPVAAIFISLTALSKSPLAQAIRATSE